MKQNYQRILEHTLQELAKQNHVPTLLLHSCCAPCSTYVLEYLAKSFSITVFYYNPNIYPANEYDFREREQRELIEKMNAQVKYPIHFQKAPYDPSVYYQAVQGHESDPERGARCHICYRLRLVAAAQAAKAQHLDYFTTTLSISPHKDAQVLNIIGREVAEQVGVAYLFSDFKKNNGFLRSCQLSEQFHMYRQSYCGCEFSMNARTSTTEGINPIAKN